MDIKTFLKQKADRASQEEKALRAMREYCVKCLRPIQVCQCSSIKPFHTDAQFLILMHPKEAKKEKNGTGRLAHLHLKNSAILEGMDFSENNSLNQWISDPRLAPVVLYPGENAVDISEFNFGTFLQGRKLLVLVMDGTWNTAKKMKKRSHNLHSLPQLSFLPPRPSQFIIKKQTHRSHVSTIEAIFYFLEELQALGMEDFQGKHHVLMDSFQDMVNFQLECSRNTKLSGYRRNAVRGNR